MVVRPSQNCVQHGQKRGQVSIQAVHSGAGECRSKSLGFNHLDPTIRPVCKMAYGVRLQTDATRALEA